MATTLRFADYIKQLPPAVVFENLMMPGGQKRRIISSSLIDDIEKRYAGAAAARERFDALAPEAQIVCALAYLAGPAGLRSQGTGNVRAGLIRSFLVYGAKNDTGEEFYAGFEDMGERLRRQMVRVLADTAVEKRDSGARGAGSNAFLWDFAVVCTLASQGLLKRTQTGTLARVSLNAIKKLLRGIPLSGAVESKDADTRSVAEMLLAYGIESNVLLCDDGDYRTTPQRFRRWSSMPAVKRINDFSEFALAYAGGLRAEMLGELLEEVGESWLSTGIVPEGARVHMRDTLRVLSFAGIVEIRCDGDEILWRGVSGPPVKGAPIDPTAGNGRPVMVLPDFSVLMSTEVEPESLYVFSLLGQIHSLDQVYRGAIDRTILNTSLSTGVDAEMLLSFLNSWQAPPNVLETVREWVREFSRLFMSNENIVVSFDERTTRQLRSFDGIKGMLEPLENAHMVFLVKEGREKNARDVIAGMGFDPRVPQQAVEEETDKTVFPSQHEHRPGLTPVLTLDIVDEAGESSRDIKSGKYSAQLKELDGNEVFHVVDYAILMGLQIRIDYAGSPGVRKGVYTLVPKSARRGKDPCVIAVVASTKKQREFEVRKIARIGVGADDSDE